MKINVSIEMTGKSQWQSIESSGIANGFGQEENVSYSADILFSEKVDQTIMVASALTRIVNAMNVPRPSLLLAEMVSSIIGFYLESLRENEQSQEDIAFLKAAEEVIDRFREIDGKSSFYSKSAVKMPSNAQDRPISELIETLQKFPPGSTFTERDIQMYGCETAGSDLGTSYQLRVDICEGFNPSRPV